MTMKLTLEQKYCVHQALAGHNFLIQCEARTGKSQIIGDITTLLDSAGKKVSLLMSEEEYEERENLIQKMTEMYFDNPSKKWDAGFFEEVFDTLMKYNDRVGSEIFLEMMREMQVEVNPKVIEKVELFVKKAKDASWFED